MAQAKRMSPQQAASMQKAYGQDMLGGLNPMQTPAQNKVAKNQAQTQSIADQYASQRAKDMKAGQKRGEQLFGEGKLGRVNEASSPEMQALLAQRMQQTKGYSNEERNLLNSQYMGELGQQFAGQNLEARRLAQAGGLRGPAAAALAQRSLADQSGARANLQRDLFLQEQGQARGALDKYETSLGGKEAKELEKQMFNLAQKNKEKLGVLGTEQGYAQLGSGDRAAAIQQIVGAEQSAAINKLASESGKK
jgi:hypothetical protein